MARTPSRSNQNQYTQIKTPSSKNRIFFNSHKITQASPNPNSAAAKENSNAPLEHPIEVIGRVRDFPAHKEKPKAAPAFQINPEGQSIRVRTEIGYRDFSLDGVSSSEEDLEVFYKKFIESRIVGVKMGAKCTIMMYGPTGSGKSHNMFGCPKQPGIVYRSLKDILGENDEDKQEGVMGPFVNVTVLEIYNEEIYDLLSYEKGGGGFNIWSKASASKVKLEVMGKKAKNATFISGTEPGKISKEIQKVEKRRIVKSTNCNDRSSRSHCLIILDVPTVGGRLMLVDMAGSENIEQAGIMVGLEAKMQTAKINQGNTALKRVVESIANGDSHVPFRDSKLTMLLQDSFEDDKSRILMILCASPDPKEIHKTISTLEYGAKAKCIVRGPLTPIKDKNEDSSSVIMGSRIAAMDQFILKLDMERKQREKECNEAQKQLMRKEEEIAELRGKIEQMEGRSVGGTSEEEINEKVKERTQMLRQEMEKQIMESQRMAQELVELERKRMAEKILQQQQEVEMLRRRLEEMQIELSRSRDGSSDGSGPDLDGIGLAKRLKELYVDDDPSMIKSMELDSGDQETYGREVRIVGGGCHFVPSVPERLCLTTVYEEDEENGDEDERTNVHLEDEEVEKEVIEEKRVVTNADPTQLNENLKMRIQNIFTLCGNYRELSQAPSMPAENNDKDVDSAASVPHQPTADHLESYLKEPKAIDSSPIKNSASPDPKMMLECSKEHMNPDNNNEAWVDVYVKWEATKENPGKLVTKLKLAKDATLADLRILIEIHMGADKQDFTFLSLGDASGAPVAREKEASMAASKLPACNSQLGGHLACLRTIKRPFTSIENMMLPATPLSSLKRKMQEASNITLSPVSPDPNLGSTPFITLRRY